MLLRTISIKEVQNSMAMGILNAKGLNAKAMANGRKLR
jgi:hypothetical protein